MQGLGRVICQPRGQIIVIFHQLGRWHRARRLRVDVWLRRTLLHFLLLERERLQTAVQLPQLRVWLCSFPRSRRSRVLKLQSLHSLWQRRVFDLHFVYMSGALNIRGWRSRVPDDRLNDPAMLSYALLPHIPCPSLVPVSRYPRDRRNLIILFLGEQRERALSRRRKNPESLRR